MKSTDWDNQTLRPFTQKRIKKDLQSLVETDPLPGIIVIPNDNDLTRLKAMIMGPKDTPYCGGFFRFTIRCPPDYPIRYSFQLQYAITNT